MSNTGFTEELRSSVANGRLDKGYSTPTYRNLSPRKSSGRRSSTQAAQTRTFWLSDICANAYNSNEMTKPSWDAA